MPITSGAIATANPVPLAPLSSPAQGDKAQPGQPPGLQTYLLSPVGPPE